MSKYKSNFRLVSPSVASGGEAMAGFQRKTSTDVKRCSFHPGSLIRSGSVYHALVNLKSPFRGFLLPCSGRNVTDHESNCQSEPGRNAKSTLQSAASQLGGTASTNGRTSAGGRRILQGRKERDHEIWAKEVGCWLNPSEALRAFIKGGEEHRVRPEDYVFYKATHPCRYGFTVILVNGQTTLTHALPAEYLERLLLANQVFDDDIRLLGVTREAEGLVMVTTQPTIVGEACSAGEMIAYFEARRFSLMPGFSAGHRRSLSCYRDRDGVILPIDAVVLRADDELAASLEVLI